ncbi:MAG: DUF4846 domain-containing protein [Flavobacteriales bacterium]|nr:DUF4846 domain-containing protein [Flavobacteriales bacterium]
MKSLLVSLFCLTSFVCVQTGRINSYKSIEEIPCPDRYTRVKFNENSYTGYLRRLELKTENNTVFLYDGSKKRSQNVHFAVLKIDVGTRDLQQCADACMRLRAEYLFSGERYSEIKFNFLSDGKPRYYTDYAKGDYSYKKFRKYMNYVFAYANTASLHQEMSAKTIETITAGDVFIQKRNPYGHAITVMDVAVNSTGKKIFLLSQSYMPAQEIHILNNPTNRSISPWFEADFGDVLQTPEWNFLSSDLKCFE